MYERLYNLLAVLTLVSVFFIVCAVPYVLDTHETQETPHTAKMSVMRDVKALADTTTLPDPAPVFEIAEAKEKAHAAMIETLSIYNLVAQIEPEAITLEYAGEFYLTMYAATIEQCGNTLGITASGMSVTTDPTCRTVAVDPSIIPLGTYLIIEGYDGIVWQATDTGSAVKGMHIDLFTDSEAESLSFPNVSGAKVWIIKD